MEKIVTREKEFHNLRLGLNAGKIEEDRFLSKIIKLTKYLAWPVQLIDKK